MSWQGPAEAPPQPRAQDHDAILAVDPTLYLDHRQNPAPDQPPGRGSLLTLKDIDAFDPAPASMTDEQRGHILGVEGAVWTEHNRTEPRVEIMTFPRTAAIAEPRLVAAGSMMHPGFSWPHARGSLARPAHRSVSIAADPAPTSRPARARTPKPSAA